MNPLNPKKLLLSKWTAVVPVAKQKHFLVSRVIQPLLPTEPIELVEIEKAFPGQPSDSTAVAHRTYRIGGNRICIF